MTHQIEATVKVYLSLVDGERKLATNIAADASVELDGNTYCSHDCIEHRDVEVNFAMPNVYELTAMFPSLPDSWLGYDSNNSAS